MKIAFISPNIGEDISILDMGLTYLATYINQRTKHNACIIDFTFHRRFWKRHLHKELKKENPDVIGIRCCSLHVPYIKKISKEIKKKYNENIPILIGGDHPSIDPDESITLPHVDIIVRGEGEFSVKEYLDALEKGKSTKGIKGIWTKENGVIIKNPPREFIQDIDSLPFPDYNLWKDINKYLYFLQLVYFIGNRGCPYHCTYCSEHVWRKSIPGKKYRFCKPDRLVNEIKYQYNKYGEKGMRLAHIMDPTFPFDTKWTLEFCKAYKKAGLSDKLPFSVFATAKEIDDVRLKALSEAGCKVIRIGVEAGNDRIRRKVYEKDITTKDLVKATDLCKKYNMVLTTYYILGGPEENKNTMMETFNVAKRIDSNRPVFFIYQPLPKLKSLRNIDNLGMEAYNKKWNQTDTLVFGAVIKTKELTPRQVEIFQKKVFTYFYFKRIWKLIKSQKHRYFINMFKYFSYGLICGISLRYLLIYFHVCCGDNLLS